jgi:hypothetical protein
MYIVDPNEGWRNSFPKFLADIGERLWKYKHRRLNFWTEVYGWKQAAEYINAIDS